MSIYSIFDKITNTYGMPFFAVNDDDMERKVAVSYKDNPFVNDLYVYFIGEFYTESGLLDLSENGRDMFSVPDILVKFFGSKEVDHE